MSVASKYQPFVKDSHLHSLFDGRSQLELHQAIKGAKGVGNLSSYFKYLINLTPNHYQIKTTDGQVIGQITEVKDGSIPFFIRKSFLKSYRPSHLLVQDQQGNIVLHLYRPFRLFFSQLIIKDAQGRTLGRVKRKFSLAMSKVYELFVFNQNKPFAMIQSGMFQLWTFPIVDQRKNSIAEIKKNWNQLAKEVFTDLDTLSVQFHHLPLSQKIVILASGVNIDFDYFESKDSVVDS